MGEKMATLLGSAFREAKCEKLRRRKSEGGAGIHFPHTPFSSPPPERKSFCSCRAKLGNQNSQSGFSSKKVRILTKRHRQFSEFGFWAISASPRQRRGSASAVILKGFLKSKNNFCPLKQKFGLPKVNINLKIL